MIEEVGFEVAAHVTWRGDVTVAADAWIAGPEAPFPIEGLSLRTGPAAATWFETQVFIHGDEDWYPWASASRFHGTRRRDLPLVGLALRLTQSAPAALALDVCAVFLGAPVARAAGRQVRFRSLAGGDPLVGLRVGLRDLSPTERKTPGLVRRYRVGTARS